MGLRGPRSLAALFGAVLAAAAPAAAGGKDLCIDLPVLEDPGETVVLKGFQLPGKGKCKPVAGWFPERVHKDLVSGTACRFTDGSEVRIAFKAFPVHTESGFNYEDSFVITLLTDSLTGFWSQRTLTYAAPPLAQASSSFHATGRACMPAKVPFP